MREQLQQQIDSLGITASCILEPTVSNIVDKYCESSIFALSSRFEGFGMVIIEAMACGVPPVSFTCPCGPRDIISDGKDGLLVEDGNIEQLAEKISYLIENEDIRKKMGQQARMDVQRFRIENIAEQWKQLQPGRPRLEEQFRGETGDGIALQAGETEHRTDACL